MSLLKLTALDAEDLAVVSANLQDAIVLTGDLRYLPTRKKFAFVARRFFADSRERRLAGVQFARVLRVTRRRIRTDEPDLVLSLLAVRFEPKDAPSGTILLEFSGGGTIRLEAECIEARLEDLGPAWETNNVPSHER